MMGYMDHNGHNSIVKSWLLHWLLWGHYDFSCNKLLELWPIWLILNNLHLHIFIGHIVTNQCHWQGSWICNTFKSVGWRPFARKIWYESFKMYIWIWKYYLMEYTKKDSRDWIWEKDSTVRYVDMTSDDLINCCLKWWAVKSEECVDSL